MKIMFEKKEYDPLKKDPFTDSTDQGPSKESITSSRTFGVELEVYGGDVSKLCNYANENGHTYGHDGSIKNEKNNNDGCVEVQTSVLSGRSGVDSLRNLMNKAKEFGFLVNGTCGTHVHLGGGDFFDKTEFKIGSLKDIKGEQTNIIFEKKLLTLMIEAYGDFKYVVDKVIGDMSYNLGKPYTNEYRMVNDKYSRFCVIPINYFGTTKYMVVRESTLTKMGTSQKEVWKAEQIDLSDKPSKFNFLPKDVVLVYKTETDKFKKLKKLFYFYTVFNDVLFKMLPYERRSNNFCKKLSSTYSIKEIQSCQSQGELEKVWYQKETYSEIERDKRSTLQGNSGDSRNRDSSVRYHSINFHSLYYKHGTVEIRMHHGTLNAESLLLWIQLHQKIMDGISNNEVNDATIAKASKGYDNAYDGGLLLIEALRLEGTNLETFIKHRINKYN